MALYFKDLNLRKKYFFFTKIKNTFLIYQISKSIVLLFLFFIGCKSKTEPKPIKIENTFQKYVDIFLAEASLRNKKIDLTEEGIILRFGDTKVGNNEFGGVTYPEIQTIYINQTYWGLLTEEGKELLIFHELGHLILKREHKSDVWSNGEAQSLMYTIEGATYALYPLYQGFRRKYYLDELFGLNTVEPDWCKSNLTNTPLPIINTIKYRQDFNTSIKLSDALSNNTALKFAFVDGLMTVQNTSSDWYTIGIQNFITDLDPKTIKNYEIRCCFRNKGTQATTMLWSQNSNSANNYYFGLAKTGEASVQSLIGGFRHSIIKADFNDWVEVVLRYEQPNVNVWLNGKLLFRGDAVSSLSNDNWRFALSLTQGTAVDIDYINISEIP